MGVRHAVARWLPGPRRAGRRPRPRAWPPRAAYPVHDDAAAARHAAIAPSSRTGQSARAPGELDGVSRRSGAALLAEHGWLDRALVWGWDEPGSGLRPPVRASAGLRRARGGRGVSHDRRSGAAHPGAPRDDPVGQGTRSFTIAAHGADNGFLWDDQGCDDVDIWAVLSRRFYGSFATPVEQARTSTRSASCSPRSARRARGARRSGASPTSRGRARFARATPPRSRPTDARVFGLWNALEGMDGTLYADGMVSYGGLDPYQRLTQHGQHVLVYPALASSRGAGPVAPAREPARRHRGRRSGAHASWRGAVARAARDPRARAHLLDPRGPLLLGCTLGLRSRRRRRSTRGPATAMAPARAAALERVHTALLEALAPAPA